MVTLNDAGVLFDEDAHRYWRKSDNKELRGVTSTIVKWMFPDTYANIPRHVLDAAAKHGSYVHDCIEMADVVGATDGCPESQQYLDMMAAHDMRCLAHEYLVTDGENFASAIDLVLEDGAGNIWLGDIKTTSALYEPKVRLQLAVYMLWFERMNPHLKVQGFVEVWLPKTGKCAWVVLPMVQAGDVAATIAAYLMNDDAEGYLGIYENGCDALPLKYQAMVDAIAENELLIKKAKAENDAMKAALLDMMRASWRKSVKRDNITISYVAATTRASVDSKKLKTDYPDVYAACEKVSEVADGLRINIK